MIKKGLRPAIISKQPPSRQREPLLLIYQSSHPTPVKFFLVVLTLVLALWGRPENMAQAAPKELPVLATIKELLAEPNRYDGRRVVVAGRIRSIEFQTGRRGSEFILLVLEEHRADPNDPNLSIDVTSITLPKVRRGNSVLVQGVYHVEGKQGGRSFERFIDADTIVKEKF
jgi:hypothetical protein